MELKIYSPFYGKTYHINKNEKIPHCRNIINNKLKVKSSYILLYILLIC